MPYAAPRACLRPGCPNVQPCAAHSRRPWAGRGSARARGYNAEHDRIRRELINGVTLCGYCKKRIAMALDHRVPLSQGGRSERSNYVPACGRCHNEKTAREANAARKACA